MGREPQAEKAGAVAFLRAVCPFGIGQPSHGVFPFQAYVHDQFFITGLLSEKFAEFPVFVVHFHVLDRVGRQVFEHDGRFAFEKILSVEQQVFHVTPVDEDAPVVFQFHARKLADERTEHGAFGQLERVGVVGHRVAARIYLYLRGLYGHFL